jgi:hypothetical protein
MASHTFRQTFTLLTKFCLIALLAVAILFIDSAPSSEACGNQSCSDGACSEGANTTCVWRTKVDGTIYCKTINCSATIGGVDSDY